MEAGEFWDEMGGKQWQAPSRAVESMVFLSRLVEVWEGSRAEFTQEERLWAKILAAQAMDLGLAEVWRKLPRAGRPQTMAMVGEALGDLERRGVDMGQAWLAIEGGSADVVFNAPRAFPQLGIMPAPDPERVGLIR